MLYKTGMEGMIVVRFDARYFRMGPDMVCVFVTSLGIDILFHI